ncbi:putative serine/Threonine protein kinases, catalytic domain [Lyophyllum shimeji]|uniref:Serine/Threonine protein kinases, catalytic domain n=1 Tax=Lyophyllum shimeji TaxID=47721 RepID=A0A9P3PIC9_LYOSH|nr:putative serine/Threonine protein kinases, catalytic domain [Lyophyllum shimeji]
MRLRHTPTLYPHPEASIRARHDDDDGKLDDAEQPHHWDVKPRSYAQSPPSTSTSRSSRVKTHTESYSADRNTTSSQIQKYPDIYSQFVKRYRSAETGLYDDPRNDPDSHYFQRGLGQLVDAGDNSEDEELDGASLSSGGDGAIEALALEHDPLQPASQKERERLEWQTMLASVLAGDVLKSEKRRIASVLQSSADEHNSIQNNIWLGIRAKFHGRLDEEERKRLEERRIRVVDAVIDEIKRFRVTYNEQEEDHTTSALNQVSTVLRRLEVAQSLYPSLKAFYLDKPVAAEGSFQERCDTLNTWSTILTQLRGHILLLQRWTGSETLDVTAPNAAAEPISQPTNGLTTPGLTDGTSFVERLLKEESMQRTFEKGFLVTVHAFIGVARDAQVNLSVLFKEMNLPTFENALVPLISFPTKLAQAALRVRLAYVQKLKEPDVLIIDQMIEDLKLGIGLACTLKRQYEAFLAPDPGGNWSLPQCIGEDYDSTILDALSVFFRLLHWKLKSGAKAIYFKETDVLEAQWATFNDVSLTTSGGSCLVAEQLCSLTNKLMVRVTNYFDTQVRVPSGEDMSEHIRSRTTERERGVNGVKTALQTRIQSTSASRKMTDQQIIRWYGKILDNVRLRYRKLQRFARVLTQRFSNSAEYDLEGVPLDQFISTLIATDHFLVYTHSMEEEGIYIIASSSLYDRPESIRRLLTEAFHVDEITSDDGSRLAGNTEFLGHEYDDAQYLLVLSPRSHFIWNGRVMLLNIPSVDLDTKDDRVRLIADGPQRRLLLAKQVFADLFEPVDEDGEPIETTLGPLTCLTDAQAHLPSVNKELRKIARATNRLAESIVDSVHHVRSSLRLAQGCQELLGNWYLFASEHGQHAQRYMDRGALLKFNRLLIKLAISWVSFICDDCDPTDRKTFKWAVNALEFTHHRTKRNILQLPDEQFEMLRHKVASCMTLLISHFDILGARSTLEARKEKEKQEEALRQQATEALVDEEDDLSKIASIENDESLAFSDASTRMYWEKISKSLRRVEGNRAVMGTKHRVVGRVLDDEKPEDRSLVFLASSSSNIAIRWQQGRFIGAGAFGSVYLAVNLDSGSLMAVKEIKFQELSGLPSLYSQIKDELSVMEMLHHPNVVEYYGIEVHRDKVYIFEEYCQGGSLAALLEHGRIEDEGIIQVYTMQMLEGLAYLHSKGIVHRDIKPDNILLDHLGVIKFVDFGAAKILAKNQRTMQRSRRLPDASPSPNGMPSFNGLAMNNSLTGTPMYMSPEIIKNDKRGRHGAMDIWSLGCVVLECATGKKPWSNLDNEWAIMFHIGVATQHPPLPEPCQLSELGINFIKQCLTIDPMRRPSAIELMDHPWMVEFREALLRYEEAELATSPPAVIPTEESFENATVARQAAIMQEKEVEEIQRASPTTPPPLSSHNSEVEGLESDQTRT